MDFRKYFFELTPLGKADQEVRNHLGEEIDEIQFQRYERALNYYRTAKMFQLTAKMLLYAGIITSVVATVGFEQVRLLQSVASYFGATVLLIFYAVSSYFTLLRRESYHVQREILLSQAD